MHTFRFKKKTIGASQ